MVPQRSLLRHFSGMFRKAEKNAVEIQKSVLDTIVSESLAMVARWWWEMVDYCFTHSISYCIPVCPTISHCWLSLVRSESLEAFISSSRVALKTIFPAFDVCWGIPNFGKQKNIWIGSYWPPKMDGVTPKISNNDKLCCIVLTYPNFLTTTLHIPSAFIPDFILRFQQLPCFEAAASPQNEFPWPM